MTMSKRDLGNTECCWKGCIFHFLAAYFDSAEVKTATLNDLVSSKKKLPELKTVKIKL